MKGAEIVIAAALTFNSCGPVVEPMPTSFPEVVQNAHTYTVPSQEKIDQVKSEYYPELMDKDPFEVGTFKTDQGTSVTWLNYTDGKFNPESAQKMFSFFYDFVPPEFAASKTTISYNGKDEDIYYGPREAKKERIIFIVPENMPFPQNIERLKALGVTSFGEKAVISYIKAVGFGDKLYSRNDWATMVFATETCQEGVEIRSTNPELAQLTQEVYCNSLGDAYTARQMNLSYEEYKAYYQSYNGVASDIFLIGDKRISAKRTVFPESVYLSLPRIDPVLSMKE